MADLPIVVVAYNRIESLKRILGSLLQAEYPESGAGLIISIDRGDNADVLRYAQDFPWPFGEKQVLYQPENLGLKKHILRCGGLTQAHDGIILLEDDLYVSPDFYRYALECLDFVRGACPAPFADRLTEACRLLAMNQQVRNFRLLLWRQHNKMLPTTLTPYSLLLTPLPPPYSLLLAPY